MRYGSIFPNSAYEYLISSGALDRGGERAFGGAINHKKSWSFRQDGSSFLRTNGSLELEVHRFPMKVKYGYSHAGRGDFLWNEVKGDLLRKYLALGCRLSADGSYLLP